MGNITLENKFLKLEFDENNGTLTGLMNKKTGWQAIRQPKLAEGFRLLVPIDKHRNNKVLGKDQKFTAFQMFGPEDALFTWERISGDKSGSLEIKVQLRVTLRNDEAHFQIELENHSPYIIEEVWIPSIGGLREPRGEPEFESLSMDMCGGFHRVTMGDGFPQKCGYWGVDYPTFIKSFPALECQAPFVLVTNNRQGIYLGMHDSELNIVSFVHELKPGYLDSKHSRLPVTDEIGGKPVGFVVSAVRMPFIQPGESMRLAPMVIRFFEGTWHHGLQPYLKFRKEWFRLRPQPKWVQEVDCWLTLHINSPEGCCRYRYSELPGIAREAKEKGVGALQLIGWARDGQDGAEPYQDTDPRLGTREELQQAIKEIEAMGVRVLLMCKFKWADQAIPEFQQEILPNTLKDMYGNYVQFEGYAYQTIAQQLQGASRRCGAGLCHLSKGYRELAKREFRKILDLGSSGILYDELSNHMLLCFDQTHGHRWGESNFKGSLQLAEDFYQMAQASNPEFLLTGEGPNDHQSQYYAVNYVRTWDGRWGDPVHRPLQKFINPEMKLATCLVGWDDREMVNQCIAYGYIINYEPYNFKGRVSDFPDTVAYGQKAQILRRRLWDYIWRGRFIDVTGARLETDDRDVEYIYSVFENRINGKKAVVVANQGHTKKLSAKIYLDNGNHNFEMYYIDSELTGKSDGNITVEPRSLVVLVECCI